jgi:hypothetical protein
VRFPAFHSRIVARTSHTQVVPVIATRSNQRLNTFPDEIGDPGVVMPLLPVGMTLFISKYGTLLPNNATTKITTFTSIK